MSDENKLKTLNCKSQGGKYVLRRENESMSESDGASGNILGDKLAEVFTLHVHYANQSFLSCITFQKPPSCQQQPRR